MSKIVSVKFHKANDPHSVTETGTNPMHSLETPMANPVDAEEDAPHKRSETMEIAIAAQHVGANVTGTQPTA